MHGSLDVEIAKLAVKVDNLQQCLGNALNDIKATNMELLELRRDYDKMVNRGIGAGLIIGTLGGTGGYLLALIKAKLGFS